MVAIPTCCVMPAPWSCFGIARILKQHRRGVHARAAKSHKKDPGVAG
jgi:hypothetical protein